MDKLREISEREKVARIKLAILQKQHAKAIKKLQKAEKRMLNDGTKRRKTIHGYPTKSSNFINNLGDSLGVIPEGSFSSEQSEHLSSSQPSNLQTLREESCSSPSSSELFSKQSPNRNYTNLCVTSQHEESIHNITEIKANSNLLDVASHGSNFDLNKGKEDNLGHKKIITNDKQVKVINICTGDFNVDDSIQLSAVPTNSSIVTDVQPENLSKVSHSSEKDYMLNIDTIYVGSNNDSNEDSVATKKVSNLQQHTVAVGDKDCAQGIKDSLVGPHNTSEVKEISIVSEKKQAERVDPNSITHKHWLHLFEEPFPRRSPRIQKKQNYNEALLAQSFNESHTVDYSDKLLLDNNLKQDCNPSVTDSKCADNSNYFMLCTANSQSMSQHEYNDLDQDKLYINKAKSKLAEEQFNLSKSCKTSQFDSKKHSVQRQRKHKESLVTKPKKTHKLRMPEQENSATVDSSVKKSDLDSSCKFLFPKPSDTLTKPGGPLSVTVDFSLPDQEFAKLKLQKIKNGNTETKGLKSRLLCSSNSMIQSSINGDLLYLTQDKEICDKKVKCKPTEDEPASQLTQTVDDVGTKFKTLMETDREFVDIKQQQTTTESSGKQNKRKNDMLGKQYGTLAISADAFEKSPTSTCTELNFVTCSKVKLSHTNNTSSETSNHTDFEKAVLINQNVNNQLITLRTSKTYHNVEITLNAVEAEGNHLQDVGKPQNSTHETDVPTSSLTEYLSHKSSSQDASKSADKFELELPFACVTTPESSKLVSANPQEPCVGSEATPFGKGDIPEECSSLSAFLPEVADRNDSSVTVPVLMQSCLQHSFSDCNSNVRFLAMTSCELPTANRENLGKKSDVIAVCFAHMVIVWGTQTGHKWQVLYTSNVDPPEEFLEIRFVTSKPDLVLFSGGNFLKGNARIYSYVEDGESTLDLIQEKQDSPSLFLAMCQLNCEPQVKDQEEFILVVASCTAGSPLVTKWTLDSSCLTVRNEVPMPLTCDVTQIVSLSSVDGCSNLLLGTTLSSILMWNTSKNMLIKEISLESTGLSSICCSKALSYKDVSENNSKKLSATASCSVFAVNPTTSKMVCLLDFCVAHNGNSLPGVWATDGQYLAFGREDGFINLWNVSRSRYGIELPVFHDRATSICFHPNRPVAAFGSASGCVHVYSLR